MRRFLLLIKRFGNLILFLLLEILSIYFIAKSRSTQGLDIINSANYVSGYLYQKETDIVSYFQLKDVNKKLLEENKRLRNQLYQIEGVDTFNEITAIIAQRHISDSSSQKGSNIKLNTSGNSKVVRYAQYEFIEARVVNNSINNPRINYITINQGSKSGIAKGMAVVSGNGVVGRVEQVSKNFAVVASVLSQRKISARLNSNEGYFVTWKLGNADYVQVENVPITKQANLKDSIFTTEYSYFPPNVLIGTVSKIDTIASNNTKLLHVKLSTDFRKLKYVYVVGNNLGQEKQNLEGGISK